MLTADQRLDLAKQADPEWFDAYYAWHARPVDRTPAGVQVHRDMMAGFKQRLDAVQDPPA